MCSMLIPKRCSQSHLFSPLLPTLAVPVEDLRKSTYSAFCIALLINKFLQSGFPEDPGLLVSEYRAEDGSDLAVTSFDIYRLFL